MKNFSKLAFIIGRDVFRSVLTPIFISMRMKSMSKRTPFIKLLVLDLG